jgi:hypothetical protein
MMPGCNRGIFTGLFTRDSDGAGNSLSVPYSVIAGGAQNGIGRYPDLAILAGVSVPIDGLVAGVFLGIGLARSSFGIHPAWIQNRTPENEQAIHLERVRARWAQYVVCGLA